MTCLLCGATGTYPSSSLFHTLGTTRYAFKSTLFSRPHQPVEEPDGEGAGIRHEEVGRFGWQCESRFEPSRVDTIFQRDVGRLNLHVESTPRAKRHEPEFRAPGTRQAPDLQRVAVDLHLRAGSAPTTGVGFLDEGNGVLERRAGVGGDLRLHGLELYMASVGVHAGMNRVRQEPGLADENCVIPGKFAIPIAVKSQVIPRGELGERAALMRGYARHAFGGGVPGMGIADFHNQTGTQLTRTNVGDTAAGQGRGGSQDDQCPRNQGVSRGHGVLQAGVRGLGKPVHAPKAALRGRAGRGNSNIRRHTPRISALNGEELRQLATRGAGSVRPTYDYNSRGMYRPGYRTTS